MRNTNHPVRRFTLAILAFALAFSASAARAKDPKLVILGFDGADAELTKQWIAEGKLPNLAKLAQEGTFAPLRSTIPSQTPVSWSTFATGLNPGRHTIFDFLKRDVATYRPSFAMYDQKRVPFLWGTKNPLGVGSIAALALLLITFLLLKLFRLRTPVAATVAVILAAAAGGGGAWAAKKYLPVDRPIAINRQQGETFWTTLGKAGKRVRVMRMPVTFPPKPYEHGELLTGLGTPDLSGRIGKPFFFTSELFFTPKGGGDFSIDVVELVDNKGTIETEIQGPPNELFPGDGRDYIKIPMKLTVAEDRSKLDIEVSGQKLSLKPGEWSDWARFVFPFNPLIKLHGIGKFRLVSLDPEVRLYLSPIQWDPTNLPPILDITTPRAFAGKLADRFGLFKTIGWTIDTWSMNDGTIDEGIFLEDMRNTVAKDKEMLLSMVEDDQWDVLIDYFEFTDRVQHIMFRFLDPKHPLYTEEGAKKWGGSVLEAYQMMDGIVGETMKKLPPDTKLIVVSDHGFASFRRGMNYNTWLVENGYMVLNGQEPGRKNLEELFSGQGKFFTNVDWSKTRAYYVGLGGIYLNLKGREAKGIVDPKDSAALVAEIKGKLEAFVDDKTGEKPVAHVFTRDEAYGVYDPLLIPEMIPSNNRGYRVGWQDSLDGIGTSIVEDNTQVWSGDHCSIYPPLVNGILFSNLKLNTTDAYMGDIMPTVLELYKVAPPEKLDGKSLLGPSK